MVLLELLTGRCPADTSELYTGEEDCFSAMDQKYKDPRVKGWPKGAVKAIAKVAKSCLSWQAQKRATVKEALPLLEAVCKSCRVKVKSARS
jgi:hypothetical protein